MQKSTWVYLALSIFFSAPAWIVKYPPMMDLPFHLATVRMLHSFSDPLFGFDEHFLMTLGRTQYVIYYVLGSALAYLVGVVKANTLLVSAYFAGTVLSLRSLLSALGKDPRLCLLVVPLLTNAMFMFGLFPFLLGIPIMFWALATTVRYLEGPTLARGALLAVLATSLFYSHIFPFGIFGLGFAAMFPWTHPARWIRAAAPVVPAVAILSWWTLFTEAGKLTRGALTEGHAGARPISAAIGDAHHWLTDVFQDASDEICFVGFVLLVLLCLALSAGDKDTSSPRSRAYGLLPIACVLLYFNSKEGHGYIWLIAQRFPILFLMTLIPVLRMPKGLRGHVLTGLSGLVAIGATLNTAHKFIRFQLDEVGDIDGAISAMEPKKKVCALIYDRGSRIVHPSWQPFLHFGSYYQVHKGGVVMFTYAGYAHWPFDFKPGHYPPPGGPARHRWEWTPEQVPVLGEVYPYYDYVLTRGAGFRPPTGTYHPTFRSGPWTVWAKDPPQPKT